MTDTTQAIRDALAASKTSSYGIIFTDPGWYVFSKACNPEAITALLAELGAARAGIEAAVLAERERCAKVCAAAWGIDGSFTANEFAERIREGVKS